MIKTKAFVYLRRSQDREDRQVLSIPGQQKVAGRLIKQYDIAPIFLPAEEQSAYKRGRAIFNDMMDRIENGEAKHIVCWDPKRLSRNPYDAGRIIGAMSDGKLLSIYTDGQIFHATPTDMFYLTITLGMSKKESDDTSAGVRRGYSTKYERGEYPTHAPLGYINIKIGQNKNIAPDPERAPKIKRIFYEASTGKYTLNELYKYATDVEGLTSKKGRPIPKQTLDQLLRKTYYYGVYWHGGDWHIGQYDHLITKDLFDKVQVAMGWKTKRVRNTTSGQAYPFKGIVTCGGCGYNITAYNKPKKLTNGQEVNYHYYSCTRKSKTVKCTEPQITADQLEIELFKEISKLVIKPEEAAECIRLLRFYHEETVNNRSHRLSEWRSNQAETEKKLSRLLEMRMDNELDHDEFLQEKKRLSDHLVRTKEQIDNVHNNADEWLELAESFFTSTITLSETFSIASADEKRQLLNELGSNWKLSDRKVVFTPRKPYDSICYANGIKQHAAKKKDHLSDDLISWRTERDSNPRPPP